MLGGPRSLGRGFQLSALMSQACSGICLLYLEASVLPFPAFLPLLYCCHHVSWWTFLWGSSGSKAQILITPMSSCVKGDGVLTSAAHILKLKGDGVSPILPGTLLEGEARSSCTESHFYFFIHLPQLKKLCLVPQI